MTPFLGGQPGAVFTEADATAGKIPVPGTYVEMQDGQGTKGFYSCKVAASQNLTNGLVVTIASNFVVTVAAASGPGSSTASTQALGIAVVSVTASASTLIWVQVFGRGNVAASLSALPNINLAIGSTAGNVDDGVTSSASGVVEGIVLTVTSGLAGALCACMLTYPRFGPSPANA